MERIHEDVRKLIEEQLRYDEHSKEYVDIQIKIDALLKGDKNDKEVCLCIC